MKELHHHSNHIYTLKMARVRLTNLIHNNSTPQMKQQYDPM